MSFLLSTFIIKQSHMHFPPSELILTENNEVYHLGIGKQHLRDLVVTVGDPDRADLLASMCDERLAHKQVREFNTHVVRVGSTEMMIISTGIGTDNIDIVLNELDALANIDFDTRETVQQKKSLSIVRIGTSGTLRPEIEVGTRLSSAYGVGLGGLLLFYKWRENHPALTKVTDQCLENLGIPVRSYVGARSNSLQSKFGDLTTMEGITMTAPGFYGPQGRNLNAAITAQDLLHKLSEIEYDRYQVTNFEMETAGIYGLANILGHEALSINLILANRANNTFSDNASQLMTQLLEDFLQKVG